MPCYTIPQNFPLFLKYDVRLLVQCCELVLFLLMLFMVLTSYFLIGNLLSFGCVYMLSHPFVLDFHSKTCMANMF